MIFKTKFNNFANYLQMLRKQAHNTSTPPNPKLSGQATSYRGRTRGININGYTNG